MKIPSILEKFNVKPRRNASCLCFQLTRNVRFKWNICNFKFNFLSRGQLESLNLDRIFLPLFKTLPCYEGFLVTSFLPLLLEHCAEIILISSFTKACFVFRFRFYLLEVSIVLSNNLFHYYFYVYFISNTWSSNHWSSRNVLPSSCSKFE